MYIFVKLIDKKNDTEKIVFINCDEHVDAQDQEKIVINTINDKEAIVGKNMSKDTVVIPYKSYKNKDIIIGRVMEEE